MNYVFIFISFLWFASVPLYAQEHLDKKPAKELFGAAKSPAPLSARSIGAYSRGCLAGAQALPVDGQTWQVMRLSRNRNFGHPDLVKLLENLAQKVPQHTSWKGLLVGDLAQARGGPMLTGHASHQIGLDADIWLTPMPERKLSYDERESMSAINVVREDWNDVDEAIWTKDHGKVIQLAAENPNVDRIFINPAIKRALCREAQGSRKWLHKVRPWFGHNYHFHVRMKCPEGSPNCRDQEPIGAGEGCGSDLDWWFSEEARTPKKPTKPSIPMPLAGLPAECKTVLLAK